MVQNLINWDDYPDFPRSEFACNCGKCGGRADMSPEFMDKIQAMRTDLNEKIIINKGGGFRCELHPDEAKKTDPGSHAQGKAGDVRTRTGGKKHRIKQAAYKHGFVGVGDGRTFTHLDIGHDHAARPANWQYTS